MTTRRPRLDPAWFEKPGETAGRPVRYTLLAVVILFLWNTGVNLVLPEVGSFFVVGSGIVVLLVLARHAGISRSSLGLDPAHLGVGLRYGLVATGIIAVIMASAAIIPISRELLGDDQFIDVPAAEMLGEVLLRIPLATALAEELAFRGVLLALLLTRFSPFRAALLSSALFGLWHILPAIDALETTTATTLTTGFGAGASVVGQILVTALAGMVFVWMRLRSGSLAAPVLAHWSLNAIAYVTGWLIVSNSWA
ncbi:MAG: CPBP family intramembrane metalloprotease [Acidimicrobiia bacterium]|nr:CPBP family intramembrane metalloprotease [Acidimicrobiia bacterium]